MWAPPGRVEEAAKLVEQWGFRRTPGADGAAPESERTLLVASRPNPLSS
jgi:hypothetical protein